MRVGFSVWRRVVVLHCISAEEAVAAKMCRAELQIWRLEIA